MNTEFWISIWRSSYRWICLVLALLPTSLFFDQSSLDFLVGGDFDKPGDFLCFGFYLVVLLMAFALYYNESEKEIREEHAARVSHLNKIDERRKERLIKEKERQKQEKERAERLRREKIAAQRERLAQMAKIREEALDYDNAIKIWEKLGEIKEAARVRKMQAEMGSVKVAQKIVHGDYVDDRDTIVKDSVVSKSNIGGGSSKMQELKDLTEMKKEGLIDHEEFKQMKKEILGK